MILWRKGLIFGVVALCYFSAVHCQHFNFDLIDPPQLWNWHSGQDLLFPGESRHVAHRDVEPVTERDREPLDPNYRDPVAVAGSDERPVLQPKPVPKPSYDPAVLPGGVVDVDAGAPPPPLKPSQPVPDFGFAPFGGPPSSAAYPGEDAGTGGLFGLGGFFGTVAEQKPWWKGPNVCIEREETTDDEEDDVLESQKNSTIDPNPKQIPNLFSTAISLSNCQHSPNKYECVTKINNHGVVKTFTVRYKCCYGFKRTKGATGCDQQLELKSLLDTIQELGAKEYRQLVQTVGLDATFTNGNYTVFVPSDVALNDFNEKILELNNVAMNRRRRDVKNPLSEKDLVLSHATAGFVDLTELVNEEIIYSENNNSSIRINTYPTENYEKMVTVNCARVSKPNNLAKNGIVHLIDGVAVPATQTIQEIIREHSKLSNLRQVLENTDSFKNFKADGHYTLFAPTDEAFNKLDAVSKRKLLSGDSCAISILKHHITSHTVCSCAIIGNATTHNVEGEILNMERTADDQLILENRAKLVETDIVAMNGVIHLIDEILVPEAALHINDALNNQNFTKFREIIELAGLGEQMDSLNNATVFAPTDAAFDEPRNKELVDKIRGDPDKLKELVNYHIVQGQLQSCDMNNNAMLQTNDNDKELRLNLYSTLPLFTNVINRATINCAKLTGFDEKSCGSVIHEVSSVLIPPTKTILEVIHDDSKYSTLKRILEGTDVEKVLRETNQSITFLAPTDETFAGIDEADLKTLMEDKEKANMVMKNHVLTEVLCCSGVGPQTWGFNSLVPTLSHHHHQVGRTGSHQIRIGRAVVTSCDNLAVNGVVHTVNKVLFPPRQNPTNFGGFFLFDF